MNRARVAIVIDESRSIESIVATVVENGDQRPLVDAEVQGIAMRTAELGVETVGIVTEARISGSSIFEARVVDIERHGGGRMPNRIISAVYRRSHDSFSVVRVDVFLILRRVATYEA